MSRCLSEAGIEHVVLERGAVAERWRSSWDSLHLLTPNWMTRLPGFRYEGDDPDGFMSARDLIAFLERYAAASGAPIQSNTWVRRVERLGDEFRIVSDRGVWSSASVVLATGYCDRPAIPASSRRLAPAIRQLAAADYRRPENLPRGGVLIVGASSTGVQLADEIQASGRQVTLAVGRHTRLPRQYRGRDILWWLDQLGVLAQSADAVPDLERSRRQPSLQLIGGPGRATLDLAVLHAHGVRLVGRVLEADAYRVHLDDDLPARTAAADVKLADILGRIDRFIAASGATAAPSEPFNPTWPLAGDAPGDLDLKRERIGTVIWATGYRRDYAWLNVPVLDGRGEIVHDGGATAEAGLYVLGLNFQRRRNSSFIDGVGDDARVIAKRIAETVNRMRVA
jgi:putative flavoprotein involved in K+ transport